MSAEEAAEYGIIDAMLAERDSMVAQEDSA